MVSAQNTHIHTVLSDKFPGPSPLNRKFIRKNGKLSDVYYVKPSKCPEGYLKVEVIQREVTARPLYATMGFEASPELMSPERIYGLHSSRGAAPSFQQVMQQDVLNH